VGYFVLILFTFAVLSFYSSFYVIRLTWALFTFFLILHVVCYAFRFSLWDFCLFSTVSVNRIRFRLCSTITLALSESQLADVMSHVGWSNKGTALNYMKLAEVFRKGSPSDLLSSNDLGTSSSTTLYADLNRLKGFVSAFPRS